ncbi:uncharacterized protein PHACADRAFT_181764 [Phanerochaete carnosa HHB-10118-sp]|uniref:Gag1-like clamp domain-containing protein n=1 Tax=Phanerochaete carnosa (strain HHB-10118-sp) TaxID=650164 RepID=K5VAD2_PHACS|nr:uncharacterized protein PHACADRAFT_181764 [Phanerochaete carnosa HHB-10118-sp]EKM59801.1 hypothetical protein PHACADRAFT_181764 [Phanerochaete carnosa HHB-10118-sp]
MDSHPEASAELAENILGIVVTAPSSPEHKTVSPNGPSVEYGDSFELTFLPLDSLSVPVMSKSVSTPRLTPFEEAMANAALPEPGPAYFTARQAIWRVPRSVQPSQSRPEPRRSKGLQSILQEEGPLDKQEYWESGLDKIWKGLIGGQRLKERLPLRDLIKILQAGWIRDGTWPKDQVVREPEDELKLDSTSALTTAATSRVATPPVTSIAPREESGAA